MVIMSRRVHSRVHEPVSSRFVVESQGALSEGCAEWALNRALELNTKMTTRYLDPVPHPRRSARALATLATLGLSWLTGCTALVDANRPQCSTTADCTSRGEEFAGSVCNAGLCEMAQAEQLDPRWACETPQPGDTAAYKLTMHLQDAVSMKPLPGITAQLCRKLDLECLEPVTTTAADELGTVVMQIEAGLDGYVQLTGAKVAPSLYFLTPPKSGDVNLASVPLASPLAALGIVGTAGGGDATWLKDRGIALLNAFDCNGVAAADISFSIGGAPDPATFIFYLVNALPTTTITATDATGYGGLVNVPEGVTTVSALLQPSGRKVSKISFLVRAGYVSYSSVTPNSL